jgi:hypothetical protein
MAGALSVSLGLGGVPLQAFAEQLAVQEAGHQEARGSWRHDGNRWTFVLQDGGLAQGWQLVGGRWYLFDARGSMLTGWQQRDGSWYYLGADGAMLASQWLLDAGVWYWLGASGRMHHGCWKLEGDSWYWLHDNGAMATGWAQIPTNVEGHVVDDWYLFGPDGAMLTGWQKVGDDWFFLYPEGDMAHAADVGGYWLREDGVWDDAARPGDWGVQSVAATLAVQEALDPAATEGVIRVSSDIPFAQELKAGTLRLGGALEDGYEIVNVTRTSPTEAQVRVKGSFAADEDWGVGSVEFDEGSFADGHAHGIAAVTVARGGGVVQDSEQGYNGSEGLFCLSVDMGSAQLPEGVTAADFTFPSDPGVRVKDADFEPWGNHAELAIEASGATPYEQLRALDAALTDGLRVTGTSVGEVMAYGADINSESALSYVTPELTALIVRGLDGTGWQATDDGGATVHLDLVVLPSSGAVDLSRSTVSFADESLQVLEGSGAADTNALELVVGRLSADELAELKVAYGIDDTAEVMDAYVFQLASKMAAGVSVAGGVTNQWGVELPADEALPAQAFNIAGLGATGMADDELVAAQSLAAQADSSEKRARQADEAFKYVSKVLNVIGAFATAYAKTGPAGAIAGVAGIIGIIADALTPTGWTIDDVMKQLQQMDGKLDAMSAQLSDISSQIKALDAALDYKTKSGKLSELAHMAYAYRPWVSKALTATKDAADRDSFKVGVDDPSTSVTGTALQNMADQTKLQSRETGKGLSSYNIACDLADMLIGTYELGVNGAAQSFCDYTASQVNWEPETFYARKLFFAYVTGAFYYAYTSAINELNWDIAASDNPNEKEVKRNSIKTLAAKAETLSKLIGEKGTLTAGTTDRSDGTVLNTVVNRLFRKAWGSNIDRTPSITIPFRNIWDSTYTSVFNDLLTERDEDLEHGYSCGSTLSRGNYETMATRQAYVRTVPGYEKCTSIYEEFVAVGLWSRSLDVDRAYGGGTKHEGQSHLRTWTGWETCNELTYALVGNPTRSSKSDQASIYHRRGYSADMYDIRHNRSVGQQQIYYYNVNYHAGECRWWVNLDLWPAFELRAV